jgi:general secretion pathway protein G
LSRKGFTLVELLVVILILLVLAGLLAPLGKGMISRGRTVNCSKNLRQIGIAAMMYAGDNGMTLPATSHQRGGRSWTLTLQPYTAGTLVFKCHEDADENRAYTYVINDFLTPNPAGAPDLNYSILAKISRPEATFMFAEAAASYQNSDHFHFSDYRGGKVPPEVFEYQVAVEPHGGKANYLFADGHVETLSREETRSRLAVGGSTFVDPSAR